MRLPPTLNRALLTPSNRELNPPDKITPVQAVVILGFVVLFSIGCFDFDRRLQHR